MERKETSWPRGGARQGTFSEIIDSLVDCPPSLASLGRSFAVAHSCLLSQACLLASLVEQPHVVRLCSGVNPSLSALVAHCSHCPAMLTTFACSPSLATAAYARLFA